MPSQLFIGSLKTPQQVVVAQVGPVEVTQDERGAIPKRGNRTCQYTCRYFAVVTLGAPTLVGVHAEARSDKKTHDAQETAQED